MAELIFPSRLPLASTPTPFHPLDRFSAQIGGPRIWIKRDDLTDCTLSGNKIRKLEFVVAKARAEGADTLVTCGGLQSNHCRATALLGARLGFQVHLILRGEAPAEADGNLLLSQLAGASIEYHRPAYYATELQLLQQQACERLRRDGRSPYLIPTGASDGVGIWGYIRAAAELLDDITREGIAPGAVICASGSGGTQAGLALGLHLAGSAIPVIGMAVCDSRAWFENKISADMDAWLQAYGQVQGYGKEILNLPVLVNDDYIGPGYAKAQPAVWEIIRQLAAAEGIVLDPVYTGKAFLGMVEQIRLGAFDGCHDLVFLHTGGIFGLFPQKQHLNL